jgi:hypothetical protein
MIPAVSERYKIDLGMVGQTINNSNVTGPYYDMAGYRKAIAICTDGASAINKSTQLEWLQATALAGTGAKVVKQVNATSGTESKALSTAAAAAVTKVTECTITASSIGAGETITINGVTFTAHATATTAANREFKIDGTDAQDATALYGLLINATYGVPGLTFVDSTSGAITVSVSDPGTNYITISTDAITHFVLATTKQILYSEIDISDLDIGGGFQYVAPKVTKAGNGIVSVVVLREVGNYGPPAQYVAAGTYI